jgi:hypothetical protein
MAGLPSEEVITSDRSRNHQSGIALRCRGGPRASTLFSLGLPGTHATDCELEYEGGNIDFSRGASLPVFAA